MYKMQPQRHTKCSTAVGRHCGVVHRCWDWPCTMYDVQYLFQVFEDAWPADCTAAAFVAAGANQAERRRQHEHGAAAVQAAAAAAAPSRARRCASAAAASAAATAATAAEPAGGCGGAGSGLDASPSAPAATTSQPASVGNLRSYHREGEVDVRHRLYSTDAVWWGLHL